MNKEKILQRLKENKLEKKQLKKQLEELPSLEVGWYKSSMFNEWLAYFDGVSYIYGFRPAYGNWFNENLNCTPSNFDRPATDKEVETALIKEAEKRGFNLISDNFKCLYGHSNESNKPSKIGFHLNIHSDLWSSNSGGKLIFHKGKWAEIIEPKTVTLKGDYDKTQLTDIINNRF